MILSFFKYFFKKNKWHFVAIAIFLVVSIVYNKTALEGKSLRQADVQGYAGMAQQSKEFKEKYGHWPLWSESMFGGMPAYNIAIESKSNFNRPLLAINWLFFLA